MIALRRVAGIVVVVSVCLAAWSCTQQSDPTEPATMSQPATVAPTATPTAIAPPTVTVPPTATVAPTLTPTTVPTDTAVIVTPTATPSATATTVAPVAAETPVPTATAVPTAQPTATAAPTAAPTAIPKPRPIEGQRGNKLRFAIPSAPPHQDIHESVSPILAAWGPGVVYSRIFRHQWNNQPGNVGAEMLAGRFDPSSAPYAGDILCDICSGWRMDDTNTLTVELREGVTWQQVAPANGRDLVASDVAFSLNRLMGTELQNRDLLNTVVSVEAIDDKTVVIETALPDAEIFEKLADAGAAIVAPEAVEVRGNLRTGPTVGTGPWILGRYELLLQTFSANLDYFIPVLPLTFSMEASVVNELSTRVVMMQVDASDFAQIDLDSLQNLSERDPLTLWTAEFDAASGIEVAFNTNASPLDDIRVRRAVLNYWDPANLLDQLHGGMSFVSAGLPLRDPAWLLPQDQVAGYFGDNALARQLLVSAVSPRGTITITVGEFGDQYLQTALSLANAFRTAGFFPTVQTVSTREFADEVWINGRYEVFVGAPPPQSSTSSLLFSLHHSLGPWNSSGYATSELDELIAAQTTQTEAALRRADVQEIQRRIFGGAHRFIAAGKVSIWTWSPQVQNFSPNSFRGDSHWLTRIWHLE